jgi:hypothetical protein
MGVGVIPNHRDPAVWSFCLVGLLRTEEVKDVGTLKEFWGLASEEGVLILDVKDDEWSVLFCRDILELYLALSDASARFRN